MADSVSMSIETTSTSQTKSTRTITDINPEATDQQLYDLAIGLNGLTTNTVNRVNRIDKYELTATMPDELELAFSINNSHGQITYDDTSKTITINEFDNTDYDCTINCITSVESNQIYLPLNQFQITITPTTGYSTPAIYLDVENSSATANRILGVVTSSDRNIYAGTINITIKAGSYSTYKWADTSFKITTPEVQ